MRVGLTGGIACGKSTVARELERRGWSRLDSDAIVRALLDTDAEVRAALGARWGGEVVPAEGGADRRAIAARVFADARERQWLEELLHPRVGAVWEVATGAAPGARWVVEVPLLYEKGLEGRFDWSVVVAASPDIQLARLRARGLSEEEAHQRIMAQLPLTEKVSRADHVILNHGTPEFLARQVDHLVASLDAAGLGRAGGAGVEPRLQRKA